MRTHLIRNMMLLALLTVQLSFGQSGGKIVGKVTDAKTGEPLVGVNVLVAGTKLGAATNLEGEYVLIKVPSGMYTLVASSIGYTRTSSTNVQVLTDLTTTINFQLNSSDIAQEEVVVIAEAPMVKKDLTATESRVTAEEIAKLPLQDLNQLITLQAGVSRDAGGDLHIRGGRSSEISYLVNGISITDDYERTQAITIEPQSIQELQVISGTFNAEYGNAMSGIVNVVTKTGGSRLQASLEAWSGDYVSNRKDVFWGIEHVTPGATNNLQATLSGPVLADELTFFLSMRRYSDDGYIYGINKYSPQGRSTSGDSSLVSMNSSKRWSGQATIDWQFSGNFRFKIDALGSTQNGRTYNHLYRLNPLGDNEEKSRGATLITKLTHQMFLNTFQDLTFAYKYNDFVSHLYDSPFDPRYVHPDSSNVPGYRFLTGGTNRNRFKRSTKSFIGKWDMTSQIDKYNLGKAGVEGQFDKLFYENMTLVPALNSNGQEIIPFVPSINGIDSPTHDEFERTPFKLAAYVQDKIELESMIINIGLRFEMFDPRSKIPIDEQDPNIYNPFKLEHIYHDLNGDGTIGLAEQAPANRQSVSEREAYWYRKATKKFQISPRLGIAYPITDKGIIRFSYGIFQQIPDYSQLYTGDQFKLTSAQGLQGAGFTAGTQVPFGNSDLKPQRTTIYELGLQQQVTNDIAVDLTAFYRDIRDWITSSPPIPTFLAGISYSKRINRDFANVRGVTLSVNKRLSNNFSFGLDYTFQIADGTNSNSDEEFFSQRDGSQPTQTLTPLAWDQTHTLNATFFVGGSDWGASLVSTINTGQPYTPTRIGGAYTGRNVLTGLAEYSRRKPIIAVFDLEVYKNFLLGDLNLQVFARALNVFDAKNPINVWGDTGRADFTLQEQEIAQYDNGWFDNPTFYSEPRRVYIGTRISL